jgi:thiamine biosynthesis protein ThiS
VQTPGVLSFFAHYFKGVKTMVTINGEPKDVSGKTVSEILAEMHLNPARTAVMISGEILPKDAYGRALLDGDEVDIIGFVGGG